MVKKSFEFEPQLETSETKVNNMQNGKTKTKSKTNVVLQLVTRERERERLID